MMTGPQRVFLPVLDTSRPQTDLTRLTYKEVTMSKARSQTSAEILRLAHARLDQIVDEMETRKDYGTAGVELTFEHGEIRSIHRTMSGFDKPAR